MNRFLKSNSPKGKVATQDFTWTVLIAGICAGLSEAIARLSDREGWWIPVVSAGLAGLITFTKRLFTDYKKRNR